jgi:hypothetical protein
VSQGQENDDHEDESGDDNPGGGNGDDSNENDEDEDSIDESDDDKSDDDKSDDDESDDVDSDEQVLVDESESSSYTSTDASGAVKTWNAECYVCEDGGKVMMCEFMDKDGEHCPDVAHKDCVGFREKPMPTFFFCGVHSKVAYDARTYWQKEREDAMRDGTSKTQYALQLKGRLASGGFDPGRSTVHDYLNKDTTKYKPYDEQGSAELNNATIKLYQEQTGI